MNPYDIERSRTPERFKRNARRAVYQNLSEMSSGASSKTSESGSSSIRSESSVRIPSLLRRGFSRSSSHSSVLHFDSSSSTFSDSSSLFSRFSRSTRSSSTEPSLQSSVLSTASNYGPTVVALDTLLDHIQEQPDRHIGNSIFKELNKKLRSSSTRNQPNSPERLVDWNLNMFRTLLFVNAARMPVEYQMDVIMYANTAVFRGRNTLTSELNKIWELHDPRHEKFLKNVASRFILGGGRANEMLKVERYEEDMDDSEFLDILVNSDLFKEYNIDKRHRRYVASVSLANANKVYRDDRVQVMRLTLRNYLLNLLVAAQTLFEFHYSAYIGAINFSTPSADNRQLIWDGIRERNFGKIAIFDS